MSASKRAAEPDETPRKTIALSTEPTYREVMDRLHPSVDFLKSRTDRMGMIGFLHDDIIAGLCERLAVDDLVAHESMLGEVATAMKGRRMLKLFYEHPDELSAMLVRHCKAQNSALVKSLVSAIPPLQFEIPKVSRSTAQQYACHRMWTDLLDHSTEPTFTGNEFLASHPLRVIRTAMLVSCTHPMRDAVITKLCPALSFFDDADYDIADMLVLFGKLDNVAAAWAFVHMESCKKIEDAKRYSRAARELQGGPLQLDSVAVWLGVDPQTDRDEISRMLRDKEACFSTADAFNTYLCRLMRGPWCDAILTLWTTHTHELQTKSSEDSPIALFFKYASEERPDHIEMFKVIASDPRAANLIAKTNIPELAVTAELPSVLRFAFSDLRKWSSDEMCQAYRAIRRRSSECATIITGMGRPQALSTHKIIWWPTGTMLHEFTRDGQPYYSLQPFTFKK